MLTKLIRYLRGYVRIRINGYSTERFLNLCRNKGIYLWGLSPAKNQYELYLSIQHFRKLKPIIKKTGTKVTITERFGLPFFLHKYRKRKAFFGSIVFCVALIYSLSLFVWDIEIQGNVAITDETVLEYLETVNVFHGMPKRKVSCEQIVKDIREHFGHIIWVSASTEGTKLIVHVKENTDTLATIEKEQTPSDIFAEKAGTITKIITRQGVPQVKQGDVVKEGQLLVSGKVEVKNDSGEVIDYQYQHSDADIVAETTTSYVDELAFTYKEKEYTGKKRKSIYLRFGNYCWSLGLTSNPYLESEIYTTEMQLKIGKSFLLPIMYGRREIREYKCKEKTYSKEQIQDILSEHFSIYVQNLKNAEKTMISHNVTIHTNDKMAIAKGELKIEEDIGKQAVINIDF